MNLYGLGLSALNAAQNNLTTTGHNISNADVEGYNRQTVLMQTRGAKATGAGYIGRGVQAVTVQRAYDSFLHNQLVQAQSKGAALVTYGNEISQLNDLFADRTVGISPAIQKFFDSVNAVASTPADPAARQEMIGRADSLATQLNEANRFIDNQRSDINTQLDTTVSQINSYIERIDDMNQQITKARASGTGNHAPNDLLDQREQLVSELNQLVDVKVLEQDGNFSITLGSGQILLGGPTIYPLESRPSNDDPSRNVINTTSGFNNGKPVLNEVSDSSFRGGTLGGLLQYRSDTLDQAQNSLGRLAASIAIEFNQVQTKGFDLKGNPGQPFFSVSFNDPVASSTNSGNETIKINETATVDVNELTGLDYEIKYENDSYYVRTLPNGKFPTDPLQSGDKVGGFTLEFPTSPKPIDGDTWSFRPTRSSADSFKVEISDPAMIAAAGEDPDNPGTSLGTANGDNALKLAQLQNQKTMGNGSMNFNDAYSQMVNRVAVNSQQNSTAAKAQVNLIQQNYAAQQAVSGVDLNEEYLNLERYTDQFRAASRMIDVASSLFDTILGLRA